MLYHLLYPFRTEVSVLNVTGYITFRTAAASFTALAIMYRRQKSMEFRVLSIGPAGRSTPRGSTTSPHANGPALSAPKATSGW